MIFLFQTGSQLYNLTNSKSDHDYLAVVTHNTLYPFPENKDIEVWTLSEFKQKLEDYDLKALEVYLSNTYLFNKIQVELVENKEKLRRSVSAVVSNAYVKSKKKIRDGEVYTGLKSFWHCIRILYFYHNFSFKYPDNPSTAFLEIEHIYRDIIAFEGKYPVDDLYSKLKEAYDPLLKEYQHTFRINFPKTWN